MQRFASRRRSAAIGALVATLGALLARPGLAQIVVGPGMTHEKIQSAIDAAVDGDVIQVKAATYRELIDFKGKKIKVISESGPDTTIIDATEPTRTTKSAVVTFRMGEGDQSILEGFTITKGNGSPTTIASILGGGGVFIDKAAPVVRNCLIKQNAASKGGGIFLQGVGAGGTFEDCEISENKSLASSGASGGGLQVAFTGTGSEVLTLKDCRFIKNSAAVSTATPLGGGLYVGGAASSKAKVIISGCIFDENSVGLTPTTSAGEGGGLYLDTVLVEMRGGEVTNCRALNGGGIAIRNQGPNSVIAGVKIQGNSAISSGSGGGLYFPAGTTSRLLLSKCEIIENTAAADGGGMRAEASGPQFDGCKFIGNSAIVDGGAIRFLCTTKTKVNATLFSGNRAGGEGGGIYISSSTSAPVVYTNCVFVKNTATNGGAVFNRAPAVGISKFFYCTFYANTATGGGVGGLQFDTSVPSTASVINCILWGNTPADYPATGYGASISFSDLKVPGSITPFRTGMQFVDPEFVAPDADPPDFHLKVTSPLIDKGDLGVDIDLKPPAIPGDFDGNARFSDGPDEDQVETPDQGAYEFQSGPVVHPQFVRGLCRHPAADLAALRGTDLNIGDVIYLLRYKFGGLYPEPGCLKACDADDNGLINETDAIFLLNYLFRGSNLAPKTPFPELATDPTPDALTCVKGKLET